MSASDFEGLRSFIDWDRVGCGTCFETASNEPNGACERHGEALATLSRIEAELQSIRLERDELAGEDCDANGYAPCEQVGACIKCTSYCLRDVGADLNRLRDDRHALAERVREAHKAHAKRHRCPECTLVTDLSAVFDGIDLAPLLEVPK